MNPDLDATVAAAPRPVEAARPGEPDVADTVARGAVPASVEPPALVEPPAPAPRAPREAADPAVLLAPGEPADAAAAVAVLAVLPDGRAVPVDRPVYVGRRPSPPRILTGPEPVLVAVPSPRRELSATHLELRRVGATVVASDMRSTNGTIVRLPGAPPRTLLRGESAVVVPGTRIELGDDATVTIVAAQGAVAGEPA